MSSCARAPLCGTPPGETTVVGALRDAELPLRWPVAHRGDRNSGPDNSRESITAAAKYGVPLVEIDIRFGVEGTPFLFHDRTVKAINVEGPASLFEMPVATLRDDEIASLRLPQTGSSALFFAEALEIVRPYKTALELDIKGETPERIDTLIMLAYAARLAGQLVVQCQKLETLAYMREHFPDVAVLARVRSAADIEKVLPYRPEIVFAEEVTITPEMIDTIHAAGSKAALKILGRNTDTVEEWKRLFALGADILMTDHGNKMMWFLRNEICSN